MKININKRIKSIFQKLNNRYNDNNLLQSVEEIKYIVKNNDKLTPFQQLFLYKGKGLYKNIKAKQIPSEIESLYLEIARIKPSIICEIGTYRGGTLFLWTQAARNDAIIISMDYPPGLNYSYIPDRQYFYQHFAKHKQSIFCIAGNSHSLQTKNKVSHLLNNREIDFLFIDGDHSYEGVKADFDMYSKFVKDNGIIGFHDILPRSQFPEIQVYKLWNELKRKYEVVEFVDKSFKNTIGIGILKFKK